MEVGKSAEEITRYMTTNQKPCKPLNDNVGACNYLTFHPYAYM